jgi:hypothetical protein
VPGGEKNWKRGVGESRRRAAKAGRLFGDTVPTVRLQMRRLALDVQSVTLRLRAKHERSKNGRRRTEIGTKMGGDGGDMVIETGGRAIAELLDGEAEAASGGFDCVTSLRTLFVPFTITRDAATALAVCKQRACCWKNSPP